MCIRDSIETVGSTPSFTSATISGDLTVDTTTLKVDSSNNRVGIRQTSPDTTVHIGDGASHYVRIENAASGDVSSGYQIYRGSSVGMNLYDNPQDNTTTLQIAGSLNINAGGSGTDLHVNTNGKVGIAYASPQNMSLSQLTVGAGSGDSGISIFSGASSVGRFMFADGTSGGSEYDGFIAYEHNNQKLGIGVAGTGGYSLAVGSSGNVGIGDSNPQHPLKVHLTNGEVAMFGSNGMNSPGNYAGIGLGQVLANNTTYQKVSLVTEGRNSGSYVQDFHILVDTAADSGTAVLADKKFTIDGGTGAVVMPSQPVAIYTHSTNSEAGAYNYTWAGTGAQTITMKPQSAVVNRGNMYNTSNGRFTAPVDGIYRYAIHGNLYTAGISSGSYFLMRVLKSGNHYVYHYEDNDVNAANGWIYMNYAGLISLTAGQYIEMQLTGQALTSTQGFGWDISNYTHYEFQLLY